MVRTIKTQIFRDYPFARAFIDEQLRRGRGCSLVVANEGFLVDVYVRDKVEKTIDSL